MSRYSLFVLLTALYLLPAAEALRSQHVRFRHWFPYYKDYFESLEPNCTSVLTAYYADITLPYCRSTCSCVIDCILGATDESIKSNMQAATIALGLMPSLLSTLAPSIAEMAVLSTRTPWLAAVTCLGSPTIRLLAETDVQKVVNEEGSALNDRLQRWMRNSTLNRRAIKAVMYVVALGSIANVIEVSIRVDFRTASGFKCSQLFMPLSWAVLSTASFGVGMVAIRLRRWQREKRPPMLQAEKQENVSRRKWRWRTRLDKRHAWEVIEDKEEGIWSEIVRALAVLMAIVLSFYGIVVFSSLVFISLEDAIPVFVRYGVSCALCRLIVVVELAALRVELEKRPTT